MRERVKQVMSSVMNVPAEQISDDSSPDTLESWESLNHMNLVLALEEEFAIQFTEQQIIEMLNFELVVATVEEAVSAA